MWRGELLRSVDLLQDNGQRGCNLMKECGEVACVCAHSCECHKDEAESVRIVVIAGIAEAQDSRRFWYGSPALLEGRDAQDSRQFFHRALASFPALEAQDSRGFSNRLEIRSADSVAVSDSLVAVAAVPASTGSLEVTGDVAGDAIGVFVSVAGSAAESEAETSSLTLPGCFFASFAMATLTMATQLLTLMFGGAMSELYLIHISEPTRPLYI